MSIGLDELTVLQNNLRHISQMESMIAFVESGAFWTVDALSEFAAAHGLPRVCPLIEIASFPDGRLMIHDGHHRAVATNLGGRDFLRGSEYTIKNWDYENYMHINFANKWVTPLDPRSEIRVADIGEFKKNCLDLFSTAGEEAARQYILANKHLYARTRSVSSVAELTERYLLRRSDDDVCFDAKFDYYWGEYPIKI